MKHPRIDIRRVNSPNMSEGVREILLLTQGHVIETLPPAAPRTYARSPEAEARRKAAKNWSPASR